MVPTQPPWHIWLTRSAINRKVGGSNPPGSGIKILLQQISFRWHSFYDIITIWILVKSWNLKRKVFSKQCKTQRTPKRWDLRHLKFGFYPKFWWEIAVFRLWYIFARVQQYMHDWVLRMCRNQIGPHKLFASPNIEHVRLSPHFTLGNRDKF